MENKESYCHLLMGKSRIAPAAKVFIPRLELCGAGLLARLLSFMQANMTLKFVSVTAWTDSTITLAWIKSPTAKLKTFVANRVAKIQQLTDVTMWRHVPSKLNPADYASRGLSPREVSDHALWWKGPDFLRKPTDTWPDEGVMTPEARRDEEGEKKPIILITLVKAEECPILNQSENFSKLLRPTAYWLRLKDHFLHKTKFHNPIPTTEEINRALLTQVRWTQQTFFGEEIHQLKNNKTCSV